MHIYVTSPSVFHTEETVSIDLKNVLKVVTSISQLFIQSVIQFQSMDPVSFEVPLAPMN